MIINRLRGIQSEYLKIKHSSLYWFSLMACLSLPLFFFLVMFFRHLSFTPVDDSNIWEAYLEINLSSISFLFLNGYVILICALNLMLEHKEGSWKKLLILPVSRLQLYLDKLIFLVLQLVFSGLLYAVLLILFGLILGILRPDMGFLSHAIPLRRLFLITSGLCISAFGVLALHYVLSLFINNSIFTIGIGIFLSLACTIAYRKLDFIDMIPYTYTISFFKNFPSKASYHWSNLYEPVLFSVISFLVIVIIGFLFFRIKTFRA